MEIKASERRLTISPAPETSLVREPETLESKVNEVFTRTVNTPNLQRILREAQRDLSARHPSLFQFLHR